MTGLTSLNCNLTLLGLGGLIVLQEMCFGCHLPINSPGEESFNYIFLNRAHINYHKPNLGMCNDLE